VPVQIAKNAPVEKLTPVQNVIIPNYYRMVFVSNNVLMVTLKRTKKLAQNVALIIVKPVHQTTNVVLAQIRIILMRLTGNV
jgi:hypothetical protein